MLLTQVPMATSGHSLKVRIGICSSNIPLGLVWLRPRGMSLCFSARSSRSMVAGLMRISFARISGVNAILRRLRWLQLP